MENKLKDSLAAMLVTSQMFLNAVKAVHEQLSCWEMDSDEAIDDYNAVGKVINKTREILQPLPAFFSDIGEICRVAREGIIREKLKESFEEMFRQLMNKIDQEEEKDGELD